MPSKKVAKKISKKTAAKVQSVKRSKMVKYIIGIDEVGRGPIAGPVTVCAFAVRVEYLEDINKMGFRDSKKLSPQKREQFAHLLNNCADLHMCTWSIESASSNVIDAKGIVFAIQSAIDRCLHKISIHPEHVDIYLDGGLRAAKKYFRQRTVIHGDDLHPVISCASILAKVFRDRQMCEYDREFPQYAWLDNKGYGTREHYHAIKKQGLSPLHRRSFLKGLFANV